MVFIDCGEKAKDSDPSRGPPYPIWSVPLYSNAMKYQLLSLIGGATTVWQVHQVSICMPLAAHWYINAQKKWPIHTCAPYPKIPGCATLAGSFVENQAKTVLTLEEFGSDSAFAFIHHQSCFVPIVWAFLFPW